MLSDRLPTIRLDDDGYPADETLDQIERYRGDWNALLAHQAADRWAWLDQARR